MTAPKQHRLISHSKHRAVACDVAAVVRQSRAPLNMRVRFQQENPRPEDLADEMHPLKHIKNAFYPTLL